jgi:hypothetical protein
MRPRAEQEDADLTSHASELAGVVSRLNRIEKQNVRLRAVGFIILFLAVAGLLMGQALPRSRVVEAEAFILKDGQGKTRARLSLRNGFSPGLELYDKDGNVRAILGMDPDSSSGLLFFDEEQKPRASLGLNMDGPRLWFADKSNKTRASINLSPDGSPGLELLDQEGNMRAVLGSTSIVTARTGSVDQRPESSLVLFDKNWKILWKAP